MHLVATRGGVLGEQDVATSPFLTAFESLGGKILWIDPGTTSDILRSMMGSEGMLPDETIFVASTGVESALAKSARLKVGSFESHTERTGPDEVWKDLADATRWIDRQGQLTKRAWPIATVGGLLFAPDGTALFVRTAKWSGTWGVPGGKIDYGESHVDAFVREIREETGLEALSPKFVLVQDAIEEKEFFRPRHFLLLNYSATCATKDVRLNHESLEFGWYTLGQSLSLPLNRPTRALVEFLLS